MPLSKTLTNTPEPTTRSLQWTRLNLALVHASGKDSSAHICCWSFLKYSWDHHYVPSLNQAGSFPCARHLQYSLAHICVPEQNQAGSSTCPSPWKLLLSPHLGLFTEPGWSWACSEPERHSWSHIQSLLWTRKKKNVLWIGTWSKEHDVVFQDQEQWLSQVKGPTTKCQKSLTN